MLEVKILMNIRVHTRQGNVREIQIFSRSGNRQGILCCVSEKWIFAEMSGNFIISSFYQMMRNRKLLGQFS